MRQALVWSLVLDKVGMVWRKCGKVSRKTLLPNEQERKRFYRVLGGLCMCMYVMSIEK